MFRLAVILMIVIPALEIWILIMTGQWIGGWLTIGLLILSGFLGAFLTKREASKVWLYAKGQMSLGQVPTKSILDGICVFAGGILLLTPGFLSDILGFLLLVPSTRPYFSAWLLYLIQRKISGGFIRR